MSQNYKFDEKTNSYIPEDEYRKDNNDKIIAIIIWCIQFLDITLVPVIITLIAYFYYKDKNEYLYDTARTALNFEISLLIFLGISTLLMFLLVGFLLMPLAVVYHIAVPVYGIIRASEMKEYKPLFTYNFIEK